MNNIGIIIKTERIRKNMKQITLSKGICTVSYLSKIENSQLKPSEEILELILERLEIDSNIFLQEESEESLNNLFDLYKDVTLTRDYKRVFIEHEKYPLNKYNCDLTKAITYHLYLFKIALITSDANKIEDIKIFLELNKNNFNNYQKFLYYTNMSLYFYELENYKEALFNIKIAESHIENSMEAWQKADFYYLFSLFSSLNDEIVVAINYAHLASNYYKELFNIERTLDCYIIILNVYKRTFDFEKSKYYLQNAKKLIEDNNLKNYFGIIYQNIGDYYEKKNEIEMAINFYLKSYNSPKKISENLITIFSLIQCFYKKKDYLELTKWCNIGLKLLGEEIQESYKDYYLHFNIFKNINLIGDEKIVLINEAVEYFESKNQYRFAIKYSILLANHFNDIHKYKKSVEYYERAITNISHIKHIGI